VCIIATERGHLAVATAAVDSSDINPPQVRQLPLSPAATTAEDTTVTAAVAAEVPTPAQVATTQDIVVAAEEEASEEKAATRVQPVMKLRFTKASLQVIAERQELFEVEELPTVSCLLEEEVRLLRRPVAVANLYEAPESQS